MKDGISDRLALALDRLEDAAHNLRDAPPTERDERAVDYLAAVKERNEAYALSREVNKAEEVPGTDASAVEEVSQPVPREASPGVPLLQPPAREVTVSNIIEFGVLGTYTPKDGGESIQATPFAFAEGTAIVTGTEQGTVATAQNSRIVVDREHGALGVVANDVFVSSYDYTPAGSVEPPVQDPPAPPSPGEESVASDTQTEPPSEAEPGAAETDPPPPAEAPKAEQG